MTNSEHELEFTFAKNYRTDLHNGFITDVSVDMEELIKFWNLSTSGSRKFEK